MKQYWRFYWPLALTGIGLVLSVQFQNAILARYPEAVKELAVLAIAYGIYAVPETFFIDADGNVVHKVAGPIGAEEMMSTLQGML